MTDELSRLSTRQLADRIRSGSVKAEEAARAHFDRIREVNPSINAVVTLEEERAMAQAQAKDEHWARLDRSERGGLPLLYGVPMTHKDTHATAGIRTTYGSPLFKDNVPRTNDLIINRLQGAGIVSTGKTNVPEFAAGSHTFNTLFGVTRNPYDTSKSAGGSSGGVAAAIAAGIQASGDGSDMGGSLRTPGSFNNIVGFRPSAGRIPDFGKPFSWLGVSGFMARTVSDVALLMQIASGPHRRVPASLPDSGEVFDLPEFRLGSQWEPSLKHVRIGFSPDLDGLLPVDEAVLKVLRPAAKTLSDLGAYVSDSVPDLRAADEVFFTTRAYDFAASYGELVTEHPDEIRDAVRWNTERGLQLRVEDLIRRDALRAELAKSMARFFGDCDVLALTTSQVLPFDADLEYPASAGGVEFSTYLDWMRAATVISATGCPSISVPAGFSDSGLPVGIQLVAAPGKDVELLSVAHALEAVTDWSSKKAMLN